MYKCVCKIRGDRNIYRNLKSHVNCRISGDSWADSCFVIFKNSLDINLVCALAFRRLNYQSIKIIFIPIEMYIFKSNQTKSKSLYCDQKKTQTKNIY